MSVFSEDEFTEYFVYRKEGVIDINVIYDLGSIADWLTSLGTIGAVVVSLYLSRRDSTYNAKLSFDAKTLMFAEKTEFRINAVTFSIKNKSKFPMKIEEFGFIQLNRFKYKLPTWTYKSTKGTRMFILPDEKLIKFANYPLIIEPFDSKSMYFIKVRIFDAIPNFFKLEDNVFIGLAYGKDSLGNFYYSKVKIVLKDD